MKFPSATAYQLAVQNPATNFADSVLQGCTTVKDPMGMPRVNSGGFALTYFLRDTANNQQWVVRCFKSDVPDRRERYAEISAFLRQNPLPIFTSVEYLERGILVEGNWYPVVKMPFVHGDPLHKHIETRIIAGQSINDLLPKFQQLVTSLQSLGIAHGDLQHGNILAGQGGLVLVDYDGMYLPSLQHRGSPERGHRSFQHPQRSNQYTADLDRFSALVIYLALGRFHVARGLE